MKKYCIIDVTPKYEKTQKERIITQISSAVYRELVRYAKSKYASGKISA